jgi:competence protein ComEC
MSRQAAAPFAQRHVPHLLVLAATGGALLSLIVAFPAHVTIGAYIAAAAGAAVAIRGRRAAAAIGLVSALCVFAGWGWGTARVAATAPAAPGTARHLTGVVDVDAAPRRSPHGVRVIVRAVSLGGVRSGTRLLADFGQLPDADLDYGRRLRVTGRLGPAATEHSPGWWRSYLDRNGIAGRLTIRTSRAVGRRGGLRALRDRLRNGASANVARGLDGDRREIVRGLALGGGDGLSEPTARAFRDSGLWHLLAVSGQNIAIVADALSLVLTAIGVSRRRSVLVAILVVATYCLTCDGGASVARAGIVGSLILAGRLRSRERDRWYLLLLGLAFLVLHQPRAIGDPGLQLSFAAVVGIYTIGAPIGTWLQGFVPRKVAELVALSAGATLATAPVVVAHFGRLSLSGVIVNLVAVPLAGPVVVIALVGVAAGALLPAAATMCAALAGAGADILLLLARIGAAVPGAAVALPAWSAAVLSAFSVAIPWAFARLWRRHGGVVAATVRPVWVACSMAVVVTGIAVAIPDRPRPTPWPSGPAVTALDIGQGDAILLRSPDGSAVLVDTGPPGDPPAIVAALRRVGVRRLDALAITHHQLDHDGAVAAVLDAFDVKAFVTPVPVPREETAAVRDGAAVHRVAAGDVIHAGQWRLEVLWPVAGFTPPEDPNDACLVLRARAPGLTALLTGDAESNVLAQLRLHHADLLKVSHHGSQDAGLEGVLARLRPTVAVISVGTGNPFGHPRPQTLRTLADAGAQVYRTDQVGDATVGIAAAGLEVTTERGPRSR